MVGPRDEEAGAVGPLGGQVLQDGSFGAGADRAQQAVVGRVAEGDPDQVVIAFWIAESAMRLVG